MKLIVVIFSLLSTLFCLPSFGQVSIEGIVFDRDTKQRVGRVLMANLNTGANIYNNTRGEFQLPMNSGDLIVAQKENYYTDTIKYSGQQILIFNLKKKVIYIDPVTIIGRKSAAQILEERREEYNKAFRLADPGSFISVGPSGAGLSIDAVYNYFSRSGKNARRLTRIIEEEYQDNIIDMHFSRELVRNTLGIEGDILDNFMVRYRPSYDFVIKVSPYQLVHYIKSKYEFFKHAPEIKPLEDLNGLINKKKD